MAQKYVNLVRYGKKTSTLAEFPDTNLRKQEKIEVCGKASNCRTALQVLLGRLGQHRLKYKP